MSETTDINIPKIVYSATSKRTTEGEIFISQHVFDYILSGTSEVYFDRKAHSFKAGDFRFAVRNRLSKFVKQPPEGGEYKSISICLDRNTLMEMQGSYRPSPVTVGHFENVFLLNHNKLFRNYIDSLLPYLENSTQISGDLVKTKIREAILIFLQANPQLKNVLFDFQEPWKIDLEAYMTEHFRYNGSLDQFAYLTGRSLSTFKRDFERIFSSTPNRWLLQKRLEEAHYLLKEKLMRATDVYLDVGFKDYSHFSVAFKKQFGSAPSSISR